MPHRAGKVVGDASDRRLLPGRLRSQATVWNWPEAEHPLHVLPKAASAFIQKQMLAERMEEAHSTGRRRLARDAGDGIAAVTLLVHARALQSEERPC